MRLEPRAIAFESGMAEGFLERDGPLKVVQRLGRLAPGAVDQADVVEDGRFTMAAFRRAGGPQRAHALRPPRDSGSPARRSGRAAPPPLGIAGVAAISVGAHATGRMGRASCGEVWRSAVSRLPNMVTCHCHVGRSIGQDRAAQLPDGTWLPIHRTVARGLFREQPRKVAGGANPTARGDPHGPTPQGLVATEVYEADRERITACVRLTVGIEGELDPMGPEGFGDPDRPRA